MSNFASPPQLVEGVAYKGREEMHAFAARWREEQRGPWFMAGKLSGFCLLVKRAVCQAIGGLDERLGLGLFADDDLAVRARRAGFELALAHDLFIHHFGSRTFAGNGIDAEALLQESSQSPARNGERPRSVKHLNHLAEFGEREPVLNAARQEPRTPRIAKSQLAQAMARRRKWSADDADGRRFRKESESIAKEFATHLEWSPFALS